MKNDLPLISVIIPTHNAVETIGPALQSMLEQTYSNLEIIIVDDNSTDGTREAVMPYADRDSRVRYLALPYDDPYRVNRRGRNVNAGYMARNYGLDHASGEWVTFQDADDASLRNRIEIQYELALEYGAMHVCLEWQAWKPGLQSRSFDASRALAEVQGLIVPPVEIKRLAKCTKGIAMAALGPLRRYVPFELKRTRVINKLFFSSLDSYPASGNSPLFKKEITKRVRFRNVDEREWPSFTGRGADRDFNFKVAEVFGNCYAFKLPLYLWRVNHENELGYDYEKYIL